jgi:GNAT superfamily N-acetyltransferase
MPGPQFAVRAADAADVPAMAAIAVATGQHGEGSGASPAYLRQLLQHGRVVVAALGEAIVGFGAVEPIGTGDAAISILCDLFVDPAAHGAGYGRAMLTELWRGSPRRMTFSSLHASAMPLYTSFGLDAWWPLLYLRGGVRSLVMPAGWTVAAASAEQVGELELAWTGVERTADHRGWAARPDGAALTVSCAGRVMAAGTVAGSEDDFGIEHLALSPRADDGAAAAAVLAVLASLGPQHLRARVCLPGPHPAVRSLLGAGWRWGGFDVFMATEPGLLNARRAVPSPAQG